MFFLQPNQKRLLNSLNPIIFSGAAVAFILIRTAMLPVLPSWLLQWDVLLAFVVYFGQRRALAEGVILTLFTSHIYSLCSAAPIGVFATHYLILFMLVRLLSYGIYASSWLSISFLLFVLSLISRISLNLVAAGFGHGWPFFSWNNFVWWAFPLNALVGSLVFEALALLDRLTYKSAPISIELSEGAL